MKNFFSFISKIAFSPARKELKSVEESQSKVAAPIKPAIPLPFEILFTSTAIVFKNSFVFSFGGKSLFTVSNKN